MRRSPAMTVMIRAAEKAGRAVIRDFGEVEQLQVSMKGPRDFATIADHKAEKIVREALLEARPRFGILQEESGEIIGEDTSHRFIVDPIDGTTNFMHGTPHFAVSIALEESREIIAGVIYNPLTDELFWAERNGGAYLHDRRLRVSKRNSVHDSLLAAGAPVMAAQPLQNWLAVTGRLGGAAASIRMTGSAALNMAYVAAGRVDGFVEAGLKPWDVAAGVIIVQEAGGQVTDFNGGRSWHDRGEMVASNPELHRQLIKLANPE